MELKNLFSKKNSSGKTYVCLHEPPLLDVKFFDIKISLFWLSSDNELIAFNFEVKNLFDVLANFSRRKDTY